MKWRTSLPSSWACELVASMTVVLGEYQHQAQMSDVDFTL
jgi:hypothetical protein